MPSMTFHQICGLWSALCLRGGASGKVGRGEGEDVWWEAVWKKWRKTAQRPKGRD